MGLTRLLSAQEAASLGAWISAHLDMVLLALLVVTTNLIGSVWQQKQTIRQINAALGLKAEYLKFSTLNSGKATMLLSRAGLTLMRGLASELAPTASCPIDSFSWSGYRTEHDGTPAALKHLEMQLRRLGVVFDAPGGFEIIDMHAEQSTLSFTMAGVRYAGGVDGVIVPYCVARDSAMQQSRVLIELKKQRAQGMTAVDKAQSLAEFIGASIRCTHPCLHLLTDGKTCSLLRLSGDLLTRWDSLPLKDALPTVASFLCTASAPRAAWSLEDLGSADPVTAATLTRLRDATAECSAFAGLEEQLTALVDYDGVSGGVGAAGANALALRVRLAEELLQQWQPRLRPEDLPLPLHHMYS